MMGKVVQGSMNVAFEKKDLVSFSYIILGETLSLSFRPFFIFQDGSNEVSCDTFLIGPSSGVSAGYITTFPTILCFLDIK